ncbi:restriction endonuclease subunit S [Salinimicrobium sediminilitoris]|uniref:restriction endonuclease subunit S n=1 Tax=Salinimicrobium sediminilitoris TaxID=2876715 RepID=UPI001E4F6DB7|nr:restriction endonuclease subunit S [Salinimicrobium sediminilitoris]MCC8360590.1 restriction endonuclease subunit S [Salinimicrobium sediminilitoris]
MREGFPVKKLGEVCKVIAGQSPESKFYNSEGRGLSFYQGKKEFGPKFLRTPTTWTTKVTKEAEEGDILMSVRAPVGPVNFATQKICIGRGLAAIRASEKIYKEYLFYFLKKHETEIESNTGAVFNSINKTQIGNIEIPTPSISTQHQIVAILDKAFAAIDQAKANIEKNIQNTKELFQSKLNAIFSQKDEGWEEKTIGSILVIKSGGTPSRAKKEYWENGEIAWYSSGELNDLYTQEPERYITENALENSNAKRFPAGSLLIGMYDTAALKMSILDREATFNQAICGVEPNREYNLAFIMHAVNAKKTEILSQRRGVRQKNLNQSKIKNISIHFPDITQQNSVVEKVASIDEAMQGLINLYKIKLDRLQELKKSILQKAFTGELTQKAVEV